jgi:hypothetical protein
MKMGVCQCGGGDALTRHNVTLGVLKSAMAVKASIAFFKTSTIDLFPMISSNYTSSIMG